MAGRVGGMERYGGNPVLRRPQGVTGSAGTSPASSDTSDRRGGAAEGVQEGSSARGDENESTLYFDRRGGRANGLST